MKKRVIATVISLTMIISCTMTGCSNTEVSNSVASTEEQIAEASVEEEDIHQDASATATEEANENSDVIKYDDPSIIGNLPDTKPDLTEDFYVNINYDALKETKLPEGYSNYGTFPALSDVAKERTLDMLNSGAIPSDYSLVSDFYNMYIDMDARNAVGLSEVIPYIESIDSADSMDEIYDKLYFSGNIGITASFINISADVDIKDSVNNVLYIFTPSLDLGDSAEYAEMTDYGKNIKEANEKFYKKMLVKAGFNEKRAEEIVLGRFEFEKMMAPYIYDLKTSYRADYQEMKYNPYSEQDFYELAGTIPMKEIFDSYGIEACKKIIVDQPEYFKAISNIATIDNLEEIKSYLIIDILTNAANLIDDEAATYANDWENEKMGSSGSMPLEKKAYDFVSTNMRELVGSAYAEKYFSEEEKEDVEKIVNDLILVFRERLEDIDWMGDTTKAIAIEKLDTMGVYIGYPDELAYDYSDIIIDKDKGLYANYIAYSINTYQKMLQNVGKPVNRDAWGNIMAANVVNACYNPTTNCIYFPAAILQEPFYSKDASIASNMGGIGMVIGHEVTHAFDTMGSQYDKYGNMVNWWTDEDRAAFSERTKAVGERYARYELVDGYRVNGDLTIGETVADLGGASAALQILENMEKEGEEIDYKDFFESDARVWVRVHTKESRINRLKKDTHAPEVLRVNVNLAQYDKFYEVYGIKEGDAMYTAPEDRLKVW